MVKISRALYRPFSNCLWASAKLRGFASPVACLSRVYFSRYPPKGELARRLPVGLGQVSQCCIELHYGTLLGKIFWPRVLQCNFCVTIKICDSVPKTSPLRNSYPSSLTQKVKMVKFHLTLFSLYSFRAPEISLNAGEDHKGFIHSDSIGEYNSVEGGLHQPLLSDATQPTSYSV